MAYFAVPADILVDGLPWQGRETILDINEEPSATPISGDGIKDNEV
jgi:hypothetical protein